MILSVAEGNSNDTPPATMSCYFSTPSLNKNNETPSLSFVQDKAAPPIRHRGQRSYDHGYGMKIMSASSPPSPEGKKKALKHAKRDTDIFPKTAKSCSSAGDTAG